MQIAVPAAASTSADRLHGFDFVAHNEDVRATWAAFYAGTPTRIPIILGTNTRYFIFNREANSAGLSFQTYCEEPDTMFDVLLAFQRWSRFNLLQDAELGLPAAWSIAPDFQNFYEAAWFGCPIEYREDQVPDTRPAFASEPERVMANGLPDPFGGLMGRSIEYLEHFRHRAAGETFLGRPIQVRPSTGLGTDGPFTVACNLFSPEVVCVMMLEEPDRLQQLLAFITEATIRRVAAWRERFGIPARQAGYGAADDSVALLSTASYRDHVLPHHQRLYDALGTRDGRSIHLCGDATRLFVALRDELGIAGFDTGFPVNFGPLRRALGPGVRINGGPHVAVLLHATPAAVYEESRRILTSGILEGGRFVLRDGNNLAPFTPVENTEAMYRAGRTFGVLL